MLGGIGVSLLLGLKSLNQTRNTQYKQFKNALLKDIIEWTENVLTCGDEIGFEYITTPKMGRDALNTLAYKALGEYVLLRKKMPYVGAIAPKVNISTNAVFSGIVNVIQAIENQQKANNVDMAKLYKEYITPLNNICGDLIAEVSEILGKDLNSE